MNRNRSFDYLLLLLVRDGDKISILIFISEKQLLVWIKGSSEHTLHHQDQLVIPEFQGQRNSSCIILRTWDRRCGWGSFGCPGPRWPWWSACPSSRAYWNSPPFVKEITNCLCNTLNIIKLSQSIFSKLNEIVYIMDGGEQNNGMLATDKKCNWHKLTSSRDYD